MLKSLLDKFKNGENAQKSLIVLGLKMAGVGLFLLLTLFLTNNFSTTLVGQYSFTRSVLLILGGISILGAEQSILYYAGYLRSKDAINNIRSVYFKTLKIIFLSTLGLFLVIYAIPSDWVNSFFEADNPYGLVKKVVIYLFFHSIMMLNIEMFRSLNKIVISETFRNIMRYLLFLVGAYLLLINDLNEYLIDVYLGCFVLLAFLTSFILWKEFKKLGPVNPAVSISTKSIFLTSYPMALNAMTFFLMQSTDVIMLGKFEQFTSVAYYEIALRVAAVTAIGVMSVNVVIAPKIAELYSHNNKVELKKLFKTSIRLMVLLSTPAILFLFLFADFLLGLFGEEYKVAKTSLFILIGAQYVVSFMGLAGNYMNMSGKQQILHKILLLAFILNVGLNYWFIPILGINGSALATGLVIILWHSLAIAYIYYKDFRPQTNNQ